MIGAALHLRSGTKKSRWVLQFCARAVRLRMQLDVNNSPPHQINASGTRHGKVIQPNFNLSQNPGIKVCKSQGQSSLGGV